MKQSCFQYFNLHLSLCIKFLLILDDLQGDVLLFLVIVSSKYSPKRSSSQDRYNFVLVSNSISYHNLGIASRFRKIRQRRNSSVACKIDLVIFAFLSFKSCEFFIKTLLWPLEEKRSFRLSILFTHPNLFKVMMKVVLLLWREFLGVAPSSDDYLVDAGLFLCRIFRLNMLNSFSLYFFSGHSIGT